MNENLDLVNSDDDLDSLIEEMMLMHETFELSQFAPEYYLPLPEVKIKHITIESLAADCDGLFAFTKDQLQRMRIGLHFKEVYTSRGYKFSGDEILLCNLVIHLGCYSRKLRLE